MLLRDGVLLQESEGPSESGSGVDWDFMFSRGLGAEHSGGEQAARAREVHYEDPRSVLGLREGPITQGQLQRAFRKELLLCDFSLFFTVFPSFCHFFHHFCSLFPSLFPSFCHFPHRFLFAGTTRITGRRASDRRRR